MELHVHARGKHKTRVAKIIEGTSKLDLRTTDNLNFVFTFAREMSLSFTRKEISSQNFFLAFFKTCQHYKNKYNGTLTGTIK
jgi:hypothetical protein